jgi:hypothetical protein
MDMDMINREIEVIRREMGLYASTSHMARTLQAWLLTDMEYEHERETDKEWIKALLERFKELMAMKRKLA